MTVIVNLGGVLTTIEARVKKAKFIVSQQVLKDSNHYIPADTWNLRDSSVTNSNFEDGKLIWNTPYARKLYYGVGTNFSHDKNTNAQGEWFEKAKSVHLQEWLQVARSTIMTGGGPF